MPDFKFHFDSSDDDDHKAKPPNPLKSKLPFPEDDSDDDFFPKPRARKIFDSSDSDDEKLKKPSGAEVNYNHLVQMSRGLGGSPKPESPRPTSSITTHALISAAVPQISNQPTPTASSTIVSVASKTTPKLDRLNDEPNKKVDSIVTLNPLISSKNAGSNIDTFAGRSNFATQKKPFSASESKSRYSSSITADFEKLSIKKSFKDTIDRIIVHEPYSLDVYKSKTEKEALLNEAIKSNDGNAILAVMMHLKRTLARHVFYELAQKNQIALNHYRNHLEQANASQDLLDLYKWQNRHVEAATISHFKSIFMDKHDIKTKENMMDDFVNKYGAEAYQSISTSQLYLAVKKYMALLKIQSELLKNKSTFLRKEKQKQDAMDQLYPSSLNYTVSFWLKHSKELTPNEQYSEENFKRLFELQNKQYAIWFVSSMAEAGYWTELERFLNQKGILSIVKNPVLPYETIFNLIASAKGPTEQLNKYLSLVEDTETRKSLAVKFKLVDVAIESFKVQKDRIGLLSFREQFQDGSIDHLKISKAISDPKNKWRN